MLKNTSKMKLVGISLLALLLTACGATEDTSQVSGDTTNAPSYDGLTTQTAIDDNNAKTLAVAATDVAYNGDNQEQLNALFSNVFSNLQNQKGGITAQASVPGNCGGSATYPDNIGQQQSPISGSISFSNFCIDGGAQVGQLTVSGQISFMAQVENSTLISMAIELNNIVISYNGNTITTNSTIAYANNNLVFETSTDLAGSGGQTLRIENLVMSGSPGSGIAITSGRIYQPDYGYVDISTTENLVFVGCDNGRPISGVLLLDGSGDSTAQVTFNSCTAYEVCVNGTVMCDTYNW